MGGGEGVRVGWDILLDEEPAQLLTPDLTLTHPHIQLCLKVSPPLLPVRSEGSDPSPSQNPSCSSPPWTAVCTPSPNSQEKSSGP